MTFQLIDIFCFLNFVTHIVQLDKKIINDYFQVKVESIDDEEEMMIMDEAFDILGFTHEEKFDVYKVSAICMILSQ